MGMINCPGCNHPVSDQLAFCTKCGMPLKMTAGPGAFCTKCGSPIEPDSLFCENCGNPLTGGNPGKESQHPDNGRKSGSGMGWKIAVIVLSVVLVLGIAAGLWFFLLRDDDRDRDDTDRKRDRYEAMEEEPDTSVTPVPAYEPPAEEAAVEAPAAEEAAPAAEEVPMPRDGTIGIAFPTSNLQRWYMDGTRLKQQLEAMGYQVDLQFANDDVETQVSQIENMVYGGCGCLVIAPVLGDELGTVLQTAKEQGIPVIAYDRLLLYTDALSYYVTFDNYLVGQMQGQYIVDKLELDRNQGPFNIELITGDPGDNNAMIYFNGAMDVLQPYIDTGKLVVRSGQTSFNEAATDYWTTENAYNRMKGIISGYYSGTKLDAVMASNDSTAQGVVWALEGSSTVKKYGWPVITGQDCDILSVQNIIAGKQSMSVFKDTREEIARTADMVDAIMKGKIVPVNDTETYDNGVIAVPSYLCESVIVDANNYKKALIEAGYYTEADLR
ncbi:MAG: substrate-binding domain-containing protein [Lachnospiraceae bacterium]|nr:substrate-binding domain-containing protein [Lachnospiraceae bacterium]